MFIKKILKENIPELKLNKGQIIYTEATNIVSVLFDKDKFSIAQAKEWLKNHKGYKYGEVDDPKTGEYYHFIQKDSDDFETLRLSGDESSGPGQQALKQKGIKFIFGVE